MQSMQGKDLLIIDDAADVRLILKKILEGDGARVFDADSIDAGLQLAKNSAPHLVVLDLELPGLNGFDFLRSRQDLPSIQNVPIIILSGKNDKDSVTKAITLGASDYIVKPFRATMVLQKVRKALSLTSFLSKKFQAGEGPKAILSVAAEVLKVSEGACLIETSVKLGVEDQVELCGDFMKMLCIDDLKMKASQNQPTYSNSGRYLSEVRFVGLSEERAKIVRGILRYLK